MEAALRRATVKGVAIFALIALMVLALAGPAYGGVTGVTGRAFTLATMPWYSFGPLPVTVARDGTVWGRPRGRLAVAAASAQCAAGRG